ncbi:MAG: rubrerythrin family protein [Treponema sp.]|nr:rubrerythrin family protein [Treponema sp.]
MKNLKGTRTEANLETAFTGESKAYTSYIRFATRAKEEGHDTIAHYFETTAVNEQEHAKIWLRFLGGTMQDKEANLYADQVKVGSSKDNLQTAINGESYENSKMYPSFANAAREEGFDVIAKLFDQVSEIEKSHEDYFKGLLEKLSSAKVTPRAAQNRWKCNKCGFIPNVKNAPEICPVCGGSTFQQFLF